MAWHYFKGISGEDIRYTAFVFEDILSDRGQNLNCLIVLYVTNVIKYASFCISLVVYFQAVMTLIYLIHSIKFCSQSH